MPRPGYPSGQICFPGPLASVSKQHILIRYPIRIHTGNTILLKCIVMLSTLPSYFVGKIFVLVPYGSGTFLKSETCGTFSRYLLLSLPFAIYLYRYLLVCIFAL